MKTIVVGVGEMGNCWIVVRGYNEDRFSISQNDKSYSISNWYLGMDAVIAKNTLYGEHIADMIERDSSVKAIREWLTKSLLPLVDPTDLQNRIKFAISEAEKKGRMKKRDEILAALSCD